MEFKETKQFLLKFLYRYFLPKDQPNLEEQARKTLFVIFILLLCIPLFFVGLYHISADHMKYGVINLITSISILIFVPLVKRVNRVVALYRLISLMFWLLLFYWIYTAPMNGYASIWVMLYPIFVFFLLGKREGFVWSMSIVVVCVFFFFNPFHIQGLFEYPPKFVTRHLGTLLFVFFLAYYYESVRVKYKEALETDRRELQHHKDNLEKIVAKRTEELHLKNIELKEALEQVQETSAQYVTSQLEKEKIQDQLAHSQKMEAVGTLAGGMAHDFNNLLGGILGSFNLLELLLRNEHLEKKEEIWKYLSVGVDSTTKSSRIIKQLLTLSRRQEFTLSPVDINVSLKNVLSICQNSFTKSVNLDFRFTDSPLKTMAEPVYLEQVILNLCINAAQAMTTMRSEQEVQGGTLTVIPEIVNTDEPIAAEKPEFTAVKSWARILVIDTGVGIPEENRGRIFEPFFTTKQSQGGSGLGLATSYGIIKQHRGSISVRPGEKCGSVFSIYMPLADELAAVVNEKAKPPGFHEQTVSGTILVIDDETFILDVARGVLEVFGFTALTAATPEKGISIFKECHGDITAVLLDLSMPGMSGIDIFRELRTIDPDVKVVLCSGLIDNEIRDLALSVGIKKILNKPYDADSLFNILRDLLLGV